MIAVKKKSKIDPFEIGEIVIETGILDRKKRVGEILFIRDGRKGNRKLELMQLSPHDLSPLQGMDMKKFKSFSILESKCKRLNLFKYQKKPKFEIGQIVRNQINGRERYGKIIGFLHPEGLYTTSYENGYNGKDFLECVEVSPGAGLARKIIHNGQPKIFYLGPERAEPCEILPMDKNGGLRIAK